ncbi:MAG: helix-turn-helix domain-containing protein [Hahellaceae bacterium]|nr:helix-turn-helix domain-containing protein [Hahellaceae bacterium]
MKKEKATETAAPKTYPNYTDTSRKEQQERIKAALLAAGGSGITTIQARDELNVMHPAGRIRELRESGNHIETIWTTSTNAQGHNHRNARYVLISQANGGEV